MNTLLLLTLLQPDATCLSDEDWFVRETTATLYNAFNIRSLSFDQPTVEARNVAYALIRKHDPDRLPIWTERRLFDTDKHEWLRRYIISGNSCFVTRVDVHEKHMISDYELRRAFVDVVWPDIAEAHLIHPLTENDIAAFKAALNKHDRRAKASVLGAWILK